jgi:peptidyl-prolyl cis-trans isomerase C
MRSAYFLLLLGISSTTFAQTAADDVLVTRGGVSVTLQDVDTFAARVPKEQREKFIDSPSRIRDMLNNMLLTKQLAVQARAAHLDQQSDVESQLRAAQDEVLARARVADFTKSIDVPDLTKLVREQYVTHKDLYKVPAVVDVKQLLISTEKHSGDEAKALAEKVRAEALADPKNFDALVEKYSDDNSKASNHGLMKDATNAQYVQEFRDVAGALTKVGEISPLAHTRFGYHVMQLVARTPERQQTFDEVREQLTASMREQYVGNQRREFINQLTNEKIDINSPNVDTLRDRYDEAGNVKVAAGPAKAGGTPPVPAQPAQQPR